MNDKPTLSADFSMVESAFAAILVREAKATVKVPKKTKKPTTRKFTVEVTRSLSCTIEVNAESPSAALDQVSIASYPLPPRDEWQGHKDWSYVVYDKRGNVLEERKP